MRSKIISFEPNWPQKIFDCFAILKGLNFRGVKLFLPLLGIYWSPKPSIESFFELLIVEVLVGERQQFRKLIKKVYQIIFCCDDDIS